MGWEWGCWDDDITNVISSDDMDHFQKFPTFLAPVRLAMEISFAKIKELNIYERGDFLAIWLITRE